MAEAHLDHPGEISWYKGYGPSKVLGPCPHTTCPHNAQSVIGWGPSYERYELVQCDRPEVGRCDGGCRAWVDGRGRTTTAWLQVEAQERLLSRLNREAAERQAAASGLCPRCRGTHRFGPCPEGTRLLPGGRR